MKRGLKCPRCRNQSAWLTFGYNRDIGRKYKQKNCGCGYEGVKRYYGRYLTPEEHEADQERFHQMITERLNAKQ